jgi:hypothetical protein
MVRAVPPFFVVGFPRSGTKMLRELINNNPQVWISEVESNFIPRFTRRIDRYGDLSIYENFERLAAALEGTRAFWAWRRRGIRIERRPWFDACRSFDWTGVLESLFHRVYEQEMRGSRVPWEQVLWGDKTPLYVTAMPQLAELFPQSRFVHIVRDPRDCALSAMRAWGNSPLRTAQEWADGIETARRDGRSLGPGRYFELRYEDLVSEVRGVLAGIYDFLGVDTPSDVGALRRAAETKMGDARGQKHVVANNYGKWRHRMDPALRRQVEAVCGAVMTQAGYEREYPDLKLSRLSPWRMGTYRLRDAWKHLRFRRRELGSWYAGLEFLLTLRERI